MKEINCDLLVVGSGAGGMTAAVVASNAKLTTLVAEKTQLFGGTSSTSGGVIWIPNNHLSRASGVADSAEEARAYLSQIAPDARPERLETYVRRAPEMLAYMTQHSDVAYTLAPHYPDYYPDIKGAKVGARSLDPLPRSSWPVRHEIQHMRMPDYGGLISRYSLTAGEAHILLKMNWRSWLFLITRAMRYWLDIPYRLRGTQDRRMTLGRCLVGRLRYSMLKRDIPLWRNTEVCELIVENNRVLGAIAKRKSKLIRINARRGVVLASGGFAANAAMRKQHHPQPSKPEWSAASPDDNGDGIRMGMEVGAVMEHHKSAWWTPTYVRADGKAESLIIGKSMPGFILVGSNGKRFTNEAAPYEDVVKTQYATHRTDSATIPCYLLFDHNARKRYPSGPIPPLKAVPEHAMPQEMRDFLTRGSDLGELARKLGIDAEGLCAEIKRFNEFARTGVDKDFHRGENEQDRYYSDPNVKPNPTLAPIAEPPFYAFAIYPGDLGTKGGLRCDTKARVQRADGSVIEGLYAAGNVAAPALGDSYPGAGSTIGPAMTFAYIAARHAAGLE